ncbi:hypothetical protein POTOM_013359 [Populus tomentosa]|uniref:EGF-like domain-containing protein n=1 Tax=Populus tomentosa TaxID=118781 RepID=A0A8X8A5T1_POPTO|nr:hypothetical protein POTOM_013359 [Populus tomentosa]
MCADDVCALINCGEGACKASNASVLGFDCECYSGWKKIQMGPLTFPSCIVPHCECLSPSCNLVWCGDGTCVANGTGHICQCTEDSANLFNMTGFACFKECKNFPPTVKPAGYLGADCTDLVLGKSPPSPPPPAPTSSATSILNGLLEASNSYKNLCALSMILLAAAFQTRL